MYTISYLPAGESLVKVGEAVSKNYIQTILMYLMLMSPHFINNLSARIHLL